MKVFLVLIILILAASAFGEEYFIVDSARIPVMNSWNGSIYTEYIDFTWSITNSPTTIEDSIKFKYHIIELGVGTYLTTIDICRDTLGFITYSAYVYKVEYDPLDVNKDGKINFKDLWLILRKLFGLL